LYGPSFAPREGSNDNTLRATCSSWCRSYGANPVKGDKASRATTINSTCGGNDSPVVPVFGPWRDAAIQQTTRKLRTIMCSLLFLVMPVTKKRVLKAAIWMLRCSTTTYSSRGGVCCPAPPCIKTPKGLQKYKYFYGLASFSSADSFILDHC
jgi:hypothetical protein